MTEMAEFYAKSLHEQFGNYYATWMPGTPLELGDYGEIKDKIFTKTGSIFSDFGIKIEKNIDMTPQTYEYTSSNSVDIKFLGDAGANVGAVGKAQVNVQISFSGVNAIYFNANTCKCNSISNIKNIKEKISKLKNWDEDYRVITEIIEAGATTVLISNGKNAEITFGVEGRDISLQNFTNAGMKLSVKSQRAIGLKVIAENGLNPLFRVRKIKKHHGGKIDFPVAEAQIQ